MPLPIAPILGILSDNLRKRGSVLPLGKRAATAWARGLDIPRGGETVLYTGHMYQLIPAIEAMAGQMALFEDRFITRFFGLGRWANRFVNLSFFMSLTASRAKMRRANQVLRNIARLLQEAGIEFGYLYEEELYSGALVYDQGLDGVFAEHARRVARSLKEHGVKRLITVDPHTTNMLRQVYPRFVEGFDLEVRSYLEILAEAAAPASEETAGGEGIVVHDSCVYARYEKMVEPPRRLLRRAGFSVREPELCGAATHCCGGPIESLFPKEAHRISEARISQLEAAGKSVVTMCPICWVNLSKAAGNRLNVRDIADVLGRSSEQRTAGQSGAGPGAPSAPSA